MNIETFDYGYGRLDIPYSIIGIILDYYSGLNHNDKWVLCFDNVSQKFKYKLNFNCASLREKFDSMLHWKLGNMPYYKNLCIHDCSGLRRSMEQKFNNNCEFVNYSGGRTYISVGFNSYVNIICDNDGSLCDYYFIVGVEDGGFDYRFAYDKSYDCSREVGYLVYNDSGLSEIFVLGSVTKGYLKKNKNISGCYSSRPFTIRV